MGVVITGVLLYGFASSRAHASHSHDDAALHHKLGESLLDAEPEDNPALRGSMSFSMGSLADSRSFVDSGSRSFV